MTFLGISETGRIRFGEHGFKHRAQWVLLPSRSSWERTQWVPLSLLFVYKSEPTEFFRRIQRVWTKTQKGSVSSLLRHSTRNSILPIIGPMNANSNFRKPRCKQILAWSFGERLGGNRNTATGLRGSERFWGFWGWGVLWDPFSWRNSHRMHLSEVYRHPLRDPLRVPFSSQSCGPCCPHSCCPLKLLQEFQIPEAKELASGLAHKHNWRCRQCNCGVWWWLASGMGRR